MNSHVILILTSVEQAAHRTKWRWQCYYQITPLDFHQVPQLWKQPPQRSTRPATSSLTGSSIYFMLSLISVNIIVGNPTKKWPVPATNKQCWTLTSVDVPCQNQYIIMGWPVGQVSRWHPDYSCCCLLLSFGLETRQILEESAMYFVSHCSGVGVWGLAHPVTWPWLQAYAQALLKCTGFIFTFEWLLWGRNDYFEEEMRRNDYIVQMYFEIPPILSSHYHSHHSSSLLFIIYNYV